MTKKKTATTFPRRIGRALRKRRDELAITQEELAERAEIHRVYCSSIERGQKKIRVDTLERLCRALGSRPWEILKTADEFLKR